jgi:hypothetical protein
MYKNICNPLLLLGNGSINNSLIVTMQGLGKKVTAATDTSCSRSNAGLVFFAELLVLVPV